MKTPMALSAVAGVAAAAAFPALADPPPQVVVTAARVPATLDVTPDAQVIDQAQIAQQQAVFAADVLSTAPGLIVSSTGAFGGVTSISIRGAPADKTLVLIDGAPVNDASQPDGDFDAVGLDLADVAKIEILSGPQASLWGSDAIGGVVAITTREPNGLRAAIEGGSLGTTRLSGAAGMSTAAWAFGVSASSFDTRGVSVADDRNDYAAYGDPAGYPFSPGGFREETFGLRGRVTPNAVISLDGQLRFADVWADIGGYPPPFFLLADTNDVGRTQTLEGQLHAAIQGPSGGQSDLTFGDSHIDRSDSGEGGEYGYRGDRKILRWTTSFGQATDPWSVLVGAEREATFASLSSGTTFDLGDTSVFGVARVTPVKPLSLTASLRYDAPDKYHGQATARLTGVLDLGHDFSAAAAVGQGFKTPTISEAACDFCFAPPVPLRPEHALGWDAGLSWRSGDGRFGARVTAFALDVTDEIAYVDLRYINIARTRSRGLEAEADAALGWGLSLKAGYAYIDAINADTGVRLTHEPLNSGSLSLAWTHGPFDAALGVRGEDDDLDIGLAGFTPVVRPGFAVADLAGGYALNDHVRFTAKLSNLANAHYEAAYGYGEPGRTVLVGVSLKD